MHGERGFTIVEVMVAMVVLLVGAGGALSLMTTAEQVTVTTKVREQGVTLQREIVEAARATPYAALTPGSVVGRVQAFAGLGDAATGEAGWQVRRQGVTYSIAVGSCIVDDPRDGTGAHDTGSFCATGTGRTSAATCEGLLGASGDIAGTGSPAGAEVGDCGLDLDRDGRVDNLLESETGCTSGACSASTPPDPNPDDFKRVVTLVRWNRGDGRRFAMQSTLVPSPGTAGPAVTSLTSTATAVGADAGPGVDFTATTAVRPAAVSWAINGTPTGAATAQTDTTWRFTWTLGAAVDGPYTIGAKAVDGYGLSGAQKVLTVTLDRRRPPAPVQFRAGRNGQVVELRWARSVDRDVRRYEVTREGVVVCSTTATSCQDLAPPATGDVAYALHAVDAVGAGATATATARAENDPPQPPGAVVAAAVDGNVRLSWSASPSSDVVQYQVYRDGRSYADRIDTTAGTEATWVDTNAGGERFDYWVTAVDDQLAESTVVGATYP
jgi:prepilin-type N-terminal cleavage/methylation domain-containing protein